MRVAEFMQILEDHFKSKNPFLFHPDSTVNDRSVVRVVLRAFNSSDVDGRQTCLGFGKFGRLGEETAVLVHAEVHPRQIVMVLDRAFLPLCLHQSSNTTF